MMHGKKPAALLCAFALLLTLTGCGGEAPAPVPEPAPTAAPEPTQAKTELVFAGTAPEGRFSPFYAETEADLRVVELTSGFLLAYDRSGAVVADGIAGETRVYHETAYTYTGLGSVEVVENDDETVDYRFKMRDDIVFSDGVPATIDDVIFGIYVLCDPMYDGPSEVGSLPIEGLDDYRGGMRSRLRLILATEGAGYTETERYTAEQYDRLWRAFYAAGNRFAQEIVDYCAASGMAEEGDVAAAAAAWGYPKLREDAGVSELFAAIVENYGYDLSDSGINYESAGSDFTALLMEELGDDAAEYTVGVRTGESADRITGVIRTGDYSMTLRLTEKDASLLQKMALPIAPLHYYGDVALYDEASDSFGFLKGDLNAVKAKSAEPIGCGPYVLESADGGAVTLRANESYYAGAPAIETVALTAAEPEARIVGVAEGAFDIAALTGDPAALAALQDQNGGSLSGTEIETRLLPYPGYGYIGINADRVNVDGEPGSEASKALRKGFMTLLAACRAEAVEAYYGECARVIEYPISDLSWAAPLPEDEGYREAYSLNRWGKPIYAPGFGDTARHTAAERAALWYFDAAGFTYDPEAGRFTDMDETYTILIPGYGRGAHAAFGVAEAAAKALKRLGVTLEIVDADHEEWSSALESGEVMLWAGAWQTAADPDMTQRYHSANARGRGTGSNYYAIRDDELDALITAGLQTDDREERRALYREAMELVMDWGCELPLYQRYDALLVSPRRIDTATLPADMTPYWSWCDGIGSLALK